MAGVTPAAFGYVIAALEAVMMPSAPPLPSPEPDFARPDLSADQAAAADGGAVEHGGVDAD